MCAHWTSLDFKQFTSWATSGGRFSVPSQPSSPPSGEFAAPPQEKEVNFVHDLDDGSSGLSSGEIMVSASGPGLDHSLGEQEFIEKHGTLSVEKEELKRGGRGEAPVPSEIELESGKEGLSLRTSRSSIDLCGPRGSTPAIFEQGKRGDVSCSFIRADVFKDKALSLSDKRFLMRFFKLVTDYAQASSEEQQQQSSADISAEDLDAPFLDLTASSSYFYSIVQSSLTYWRA
ncbi:unnamed protein product [Calypogeia fissa]